MGKRTRNLLILAVVLFLCCFGGSIANPFADDDDSDSNPIVDFLGKFAGSADAVPDSDIQASCKTQPNKFVLTAPASVSCVLNVKAGGTGLRNLILTSNQKIKVSSPVPNKDFTVSDDFDPNKEIKVAIDEQGGAVTLRCLAPSCVVTRGDGS